MLPLPRASPIMITTLSITFFPSNIQMPETDLLVFFFFKSEENFPRSPSGRLLICQNCVNCPHLNPILDKRNRIIIVDIY